MQEHVQHSFYELERQRFLLNVPSSEGCHVAIRRNVGSGVDRFLAKGVWLHVLHRFATV